MCFGLSIFLGWITEKMLTISIEFCGGLAAVVGHGPRRKYLILMANLILLWILVHFSRLYRIGHKLTLSQQVMCRF